MVHPSRQRHLPRQIQPLDSLSASDVTNQGHRAGPVVNCRNVGNRLDSSVIGSGSFSCAISKATFHSFAFWVLAVVVCLSTSSALAQDQYMCEDLQRGDFSTFPHVLPSACSGYIDYRVGVPIGSSQDEMESALAYLPTANAALSPLCLEAVNKALCALTYPKCVSSSSSDSSSTSTVLTKPCTSLCIGMASSCNSRDVSVLKIAGLLSHFSCTNSNIWSPVDETCNSGASSGDTDWENSDDDEKEEKEEESAFMAPRCVTYTGNVCAGAVPGPIYLPPGFSQETLEQRLVAWQLAFSLAPTSVPEPVKGDERVQLLPNATPILSFPSEPFSRLFYTASSRNGEGLSGNKKVLSDTPSSLGCDRSMVAWACSQVFQECAYSPLDPTGKEVLASITIPVPRTPCRELCSQYNSACEPLFSVDETLREVLSADCEAPELASATTTVIMLPGSTTDASFPGFPVVSQCSNWQFEDVDERVNSSVNAETALLRSEASLHSVTISTGPGSAARSVNAVCDSRLVNPLSNSDTAWQDNPGSLDTLSFPFQRIAGGACSPICPSPVFSSTSHSALSSLALAGAILSLLCCVFVLATWLLFGGFRGAVVVLEDPFRRIQRLLRLQDLVQLYHIQQKAKHAVVRKAESQVVVTTSAMPSTSHSTAASLTDASPGLPHPTLRASTGIGGVSSSTSSTSPVSPALTISVPMSMGLVKSESFSRVTSQPISQPLSQPINTSTALITTTNNITVQVTEDNIAVALRRLRPRGPPSAARLGLRHIPRLRASSSLFFLQLCLLGVSILIIAVAIRTTSLGFDSAAASFCPTVTRTTLEGSVSTLTPAPSLSIAAWAAYVSDFDFSYLSSSISLSFSEQAFCQTQGGLTVFFLLAAVSWWLVFVVEAARRILFPRLVVMVPPSLRRQLFRAFPSLRQAVYTHPHFINAAKVDTKTKTKTEMNTSSSLSPTSRPLPVGSSFLPQPPYICLIHPHLSSSVTSSVPAKTNSSSNLNYPPRATQSLISPDNTTGKEEISSIELQISVPSKDLKKGNEGVSSKAIPGLSCENKTLALVPIFAQTAVSDSPPGPFVGGRHRSMFTPAQIIFAQHFFSWGIPLLLTVALLVVGQIGWADWGITSISSTSSNAFQFQGDLGALGSALPWCLLNQGPHPDHGIDFGLGLFYYPILAYSAMGLVLTLATVVISLICGNTPIAFPHDEEEREELKRRELQLKNSVKPQRLSRAELKRKEEKRKQRKERKERNNKRKARAEVKAARRVEREKARMTIKISEADDHVYGQTPGSAALVGAPITATMTGSVLVNPSPSSLSMSTSLSPPTNIASEKRFVEAPITSLNDSLGWVEQDKGENEQFLADNVEGVQSASVANLENPESMYPSLAALNIPMGYDAFVQPGESPFVQEEKMKNRKHGKGKRKGKKKYRVEPVNEENMETAFFSESVSDADFAIYGASEEEGEDDEEDEESEVESTNVKKKVEEKDPIVVNIDETDSSDSELEPESDSEPEHEVNSSTIPEPVMESNLMSQNSLTSSTYPSRLAHIRKELDVKEILECTCHSRSVTGSVSSLSSSQSSDLAQYLRLSSSKTFVEANWRLAGMYGYGVPSAHSLWLSDEEASEVDSDTEFGLDDGISEVNFENASSLGFNKPNPALRPIEAAANASNASSGSFQSSQSASILSSPTVAKPRASSLFKSQNNSMFGTARGRSSFTGGTALMASPSTNTTTSRPLTASSLGHTSLVSSVNSNGDGHAFLTTKDTIRDSMSAMTSTDDRIFHSTDNNAMEGEKDEEEEEEEGQDTIESLESSRNSRTSWSSRNSLQQSSSFRVSLNLELESNAGEGMSDFSNMSTSQEKNSHNRSTFPSTFSSPPLSFGTSTMLETIPSPMSINSTSVSTFSSFGGAKAQKNPQNGQNTQTTSTSSIALTKGNKPSAVPPSTTGLGLQLDASAMLRRARRYSTYTPQIYVSDMDDSIDGNSSSLSTFTDSAPSLSSLASFTSSKNFSNAFSARKSLSSMGLISRNQAQRRVSRVSQVSLAKADSEEASSSLFPRSSFPTYGYSTEFAFSADYADSVALTTALNSTSSKTISSPNSSSRDNSSLLHVHPHRLSFTVAAYIIILGLIWLYIPLHKLAIESSRETITRGAVLRLTCALLVQASPLISSSIWEGVDCWNDSSYPPLDTAGRVLSFLMGLGEIEGTDSISSTALMATRNSTSASVATLAVLVLVMAFVGCLGLLLMPSPGSLLRGWLGVLYDISPTIAPASWRQYSFPALAQPDYNALARARKERQARSVTGRLSTASSMPSAPDALRMSASASAIAGSSQATTVIQSPAQEKRKAMMFRGSVALKTPLPSSFADTSRASGRISGKLDVGNELSSVSKSDIGSVRRSTIDFAATKGLPGRYMFSDAKNSAASPTASTSTVGDVSVDLTEKENESAPLTNSINTKRNFSLSFSSHSPHSPHSPLSPLSPLSTLSPPPPRAATTVFPGIEMSSGSTTLSPPPPRQSLVGSPSFSRNAENLYYVEEENTLGAQREGEQKGEGRNEGNNDDGDDDDDDDDGEEELTDRKVSNNVISANTDEANNNTLESSRDRDIDAADASEKLFVPLQGRSLAKTQSNTLGRALGLHPDQVAQREEANLSNEIDLETNQAQD